MSNSKDREVLRKLEMIARLKPSQESTDRAMAAVRRQLRQHPTGVPTQSRRAGIVPLLARHWVKLGMAAMIFISLGIAVIYKYPRRSVPHPDPVAYQPPVSSPVLPEVEVNPTPVRIAMQVPPLQDAELARELNQIDRMAANMDLPGLHDKSASPHERISLAAAHYLAQLGGQEELDRLRDLNQRLAGSESTGLYLPFIETLQQRLNPDVAAAGSPSESLPLSGAATAARGCFSGVIRDSKTGEPVPGAIVQLHGSLTYETLADANGFYSFDEWVQAGSYGVSLQSLGYLGFTESDQLPVVAIDPNQTLQRHFYLDPGCMVHVQVQDEAGLPVPDAEVGLSWLGIDQQNDAGLRRVTDAQGQATIGAVRPAEIAYQVTALHRQFAPQYVTVKCTDPNVIESVSVTLSLGYDVPGIATYRDGVPAKGIRMSAVPSWWQSQTLVNSVSVDSEGAFVLNHLVDGNYTIVAFYATDQGFRNSRIVGQIQVPLDDEVLECTVPFNSPQSQAILSGSIQWTTDQRSDQIYATAIRLNDNPGIFLKKLVIVEDQFVMDQLTPGIYSLMLEGPNLRQTLFKEVFVPQNDFEVTLAYESTPHFNGQILAADTGLPVQDYKVSLQKMTDSRMPLLILPASQWIPVSHPDGFFDIQTKGPGVYRMQVVAEGYVPYDVGLVNTDQQDPIDLELSHGGILTGRVQTSQGEPIDGAHISLVMSAQMPQPENPWTERFVMNALSQQGVFSFSAVPYGNHQIEVTHPSYNPLVLNSIDIQDGQEDETLNIVLEERVNP